MTREAVEPASPVSNVFAVELVHVRRRFGEILALGGVDLSIRSGEFFSLLGPSGCGKTTLLRLIAGLELPDQGLVRISGRDATHAPAHQRPVNTVFQSYALFPHLNVQDNVAFGLRMKKLGESEIAERVGRILETVHISELAGRQPSQLSGGQKQRVALARAIVNEPQVLLLDEPLGALDLKLRKELQVELHALQRRLGMTFVYVTHDQEESLVMSDRIAVMNAGRIEQLGLAQEIYESPRTRFVAQFLGSCNLFSGTVEGQDGGALRVRTGFGPLNIEPNSGVRPLRGGDSCTVAIRPEKVQLLQSNKRCESNSFTARVADFVYTGSETQYSVEGHGVTLKAWILNASAGSPGIRIGQEVVVQLPPAALVVLED